MEQEPVYSSEWEQTAESIPQDTGLSPLDRLILESYKTTMEGLAAYFGEAFEFVLHDLTDFDHSIVKIVNGFHSKRQEGAPITDFALSMLEQIQEKKCPDRETEPFISYTSRGKYGKLVKSTTIMIFGEQRRVIGLLCVNLYFDSPIYSVLRNFSLVPQADFVSENFTSDSGELITRALEKARVEVNADSAVLQSQKNKEIIALLYHQGIFKLKNAVQHISLELGISRNTVYLHLRTLEEKG
jgi:predicted transcriptional regulator YheO